MMTHLFVLLCRYKWRSVYRYINVTWLETFWFPLLLHTYTALYYQLVKWNSDEFQRVCNPKRTNSYCLSVCDTLTQHDICGSSFNSTVSTSRYEKDKTLQFDKKKPLKGRKRKYSLFCSNLLVGHFRHVSILYGQCVLIVLLCNQEFLYEVKPTAKSLYVKEKNSMQQLHG